MLQISTCIAKCELVINTVEDSNMYMYIIHTHTYVLQYSGTSDSDFGTSDSDFGVHIPLGQLELSLLHTIFYTFGIHV